MKKSLFVLTILLLSHGIPLIGTAFAGEFNAMGSGTCTLIIEAKEGDKVTVDGRNYNGFPVEYKDIAAGSHNVFMVRKGCKPFLKSVSVRAGETLKITPDFGVCEDPVLIAEREQAAIDAAEKARDAEEAREEAAKPQYAAFHVVPVKTAIDKAALAVLKKWDQKNYGAGVSWNEHIENGDGINSTGGVIVRFSDGSKFHTVLSVELPGTLTQDIVDSAKVKGLKFTKTTTTAFVIWLGKFKDAHLVGVEIGKHYEGADGIRMSEKSAMSAAVKLAAAAANDDLEGLSPLLQAYSASRKK